MNEFGSRLKSLRNSKKLSQRELAERFNISQSAIAYYESGKKEPNHEMLQRLADFFKVSIDYLLGRTGIRTDEELDQIVDQELQDIIQKYEKMDKEERREFRQFFEMSLDVYTKRKEQERRDRT